MVLVAHVRGWHIHDFFDRNPSLFCIRRSGREALTGSVDRECDVSERRQEHRLLRAPAPMMAVTNNDRRIRSADHWTRQIPVDTYVPTGVYCVRRHRCSPRRIFIGVEVDLKVADLRSDTVVQRARIPNSELSVGRPEVERCGLRERATPRTANKEREE